MRFLHGYKIIRVVILVILGGAGFYLAYRAYNIVRRVPFHDRKLELYIYETYVEDEHDYEPSYKVYAWEIRDARPLSIEEGIGDLAGIEYCINLESLDISSRSIEDISPLAKLKRLKRLKISNSPIKDWKPLSKLTNLESLDITNTIVNPSFLPRLTRLTFLSMIDCDLEDISSLSRLRGLQGLNLKSNQIENLYVLHGMDKLRDLDLSFNRIHDISSLSRLHNLAAANLEHNQIADLSPLADLKALEILNLNTNRIRDISFLASINNLREVDLSYNMVDVSSLLRPVQGVVNLSRLVDINLDYNDILDISTLAQWHERGIYPQRIMLAYNRIADISPLGKIHSLIYLWWQCYHERGISSSWPVEEPCKRLYSKEEDSERGLLIDMGELNALGIDLSSNAIETLEPLASSMPDYSLLEVNGSSVGAGISLYLRGNPLTNQTIKDDLPVILKKGIYVVDLE